MCTNNRNPLHCILPPHVLAHIAKNGNSLGARSAAVDTLVHDAHQRSMRLLQSAVSTSATRLAQTLRAGINPLGPQITVMDGKSQEVTSGPILRTANTGPSDDQDAEQAFKGLNATWDFYNAIYERNSIDNAGMPINAVVHYGSLYDNAFWDGTEMVFGDGDGVTFTHFTKCIDVIGHELTHGVTQTDLGLIYQGQSGALNESISDIFGSMIKQYDAKQSTADADWLIGQGLLLHDPKVALRSMKNPGSAYKNDPVLGNDPQPKNMKDYIKTGQDNGGVHLNSGIPNYAFFLIADGMGGFSWQKAGQIWYNTLRDNRLKPNATFSEFASRTIANAITLYGADSKEVSIVQDSWAKVGVS